jgi:hypothetical protein
MVIHSSKNQGCGSESASGLDSDSMNLWIGIWISIQNLDPRSVSRGKKEEENNVKFTLSF